MTEISRPWTGTTTGDAGAYSASDWRDAWAAAYHAWAHGTDYGNRGPLIDSGNAPDVGLQVQATGPASAAVDVLPGAALVEGGLYLSDATETLAVAANSSGNPRIDTVILRKDDIAQTIRLAVKQGTPAVTPTPPALTQTAGTMWEIPIWDIAVANGFTSITDDDLTPRAEWANAAEGVYLKDVLNNGGSTVETGAVVVWDGTADRAIHGTTTPNDPAVAGVWVGRTQNGDYGRVLARGIGWVRMLNNGARGDGLMASGTAFQADTTGIGYGNLGFLLEAATAGNLALAYIDPQRAQNQVATFAYEVAQNTAGPAYTTGAERTVSVNTELSDPYGIASVNANQITLAPGRYRFWGEIAVIGVAGATRLGWLLLHDTTAGARLLKSNNFLLGSSSFDTIALAGEFALTVQSVLEMRVLVTSTGWTGVGAAINSAGETERYTYMEFERIP